MRSIIILATLLAACAPVTETELGFELATADRPDAEYTLELDIDMDACSDYGGVAVIYNEPGHADNHMYIVPVDFDTQAMAAWGIVPEGVVLAPQEEYIFRSGCVGEYLGRDGDYAYVEILTTGGHFQYEAIVPVGENLVNYNVVY